MLKFKKGFIAQIIMMIFLPGLVWQRSAYSISFTLRVPLANSQRSATERQLKALQYEKTKAELLEIKNVYPSPQECLDEWMNVLAGQATYSQPDAVTRVVSLGRYKTIGSFPRGAYTIWDVGAGRSILIKNMLQTDVIGTGRNLVGCTGVLIKGTMDGKDVIAFAHLSNSFDSTLNNFLETVDNLRITNPMFIFNVVNRESGENTVNELETAKRLCSASKYPTLFMAREANRIKIEERELDTKMFCTTKGVLVWDEQSTKARTWEEIFPSDNIEDILQAAVRRNRAHLIWHWEKKKEAKYGNPLSAEALAEGGLCAKAMADISGLINLLAADNKKEINIKLRQAQTIFKGFSHNFIVLSYAGKNYLIDTTFMQYFDKSKEVVDEIIIEDDIAYTSSVAGLVYPWRILEQSNKQEWVALSHQLLKEGYIELTDEVADMYGNLMAGKFPISRTFTKEDLLQAPDDEYLSPEKVSAELGDLGKRSQDLTAPDMVRLNYYLGDPLLLIGLQPGTISNRLKRQDIDTGL